MKITDWALVEIDGFVLVAPDGSLLTNDDGKHNEIYRTEEDARKRLREIDAVRGYRIVDLRTLRVADENVVPNNIFVNTHFADEIFVDLLGKPLPPITQLNVLILLAKGKVNEDSSKEFLDNSEEINDLVMPMFRDNCWSSRQVTGVLNALVVKMRGEKSTAAKA
jgi:hypothetical protein